MEESEESGLHCETRGGSSAVQRGRGHPEEVRPLRGDWVRQRRTTLLRKNIDVFLPLLYKHIFCAC